MLPRPATGLLLAFVALMVALLGATAEHPTAGLPLSSTAAETETEHCPDAPAHPQPRCAHRAARLGTTDRAAPRTPVTRPSTTLALAVRLDGHATTDSALTRTTARSPAALQVFRI